MKNSLPEKEFEYIKKNSFEPDNLKDSIEKVFTYDNFKYIRRKPSWEDVLNEFSKPGICDLTLNSAILNKQDGFVGHRVVLIDINENEIVFHDPNINGDGAYRCESTDIFRKAFDDNPELTRYSLKN